MPNTAMGIQQATTPEFGELDGIEHRPHGRTNISTVYGWRVGAIAMVYTDPVTKPPKPGRIRN